MLFDLLARSSYTARLGAAAAALAVAVGLVGTATASTVIADWTLNAAPVAGGGYVGYVTAVNNQGVVPLDTTGTYDFLYQAYMSTPPAGPQIGGAPTPVSTQFNGGGFYGAQNQATLTTAVGNSFSISCSVP